MAMATATSRFLLQTTTSLLRHRASTSFPPSLLPFPTTTSRHVLHVPPSNTLLRLCSTSATEVSVSVPDDLDVHPWAEWEGFLEKLKGKGYFDKSSSEATGEEGVSEEGRDVNLRLTSPSYFTRVKVACLGFARERPDLLRSLPRKDIQAVVECGCPNLLRKSVNSAKRLRAYLNLDEGDVCSSCNLRESCDRAYVMASKDEGARTVDIVRILLQYAAPLAADSVEKHSLQETVEEAVRKLLLELTNLSDTTPDPDLLKAVVKPNVRKEVMQDAKVWDMKQHQNAEMKRGDWMCPECNFMNYARNVRCLRCKADGPKRVSFNSPEMKKGDWTCERCQFMNFARNTVCRKCQEARAKKELAPGEWECPKCNFLNFRRNRACLKCNCDRPRDESGQYDDGVWRRPKFSIEASEHL